MTDGTTSRARVWTALYLAGVSAVTGELFWRQRFGPARLGELQHHLELARELADHPATVALPHPGFHVVVLLVDGLTGMGMENAGVLVCTAIAALLAALVLAVISDALPGRPGAAAAWSAAAMTVSSLWVPWFSRNFYLGQGSANVWAVPTLPAVKPFALLAVLLWLRALRGAGGTVLLAVVLAASVAVKPNFVLVFFPAALVYLLVRHRGDRAAWRRTVAVGLPTAAALALQYWLWFGRGPQGGIQPTFFGVWRLYTPNVAVSVLLALAFPLALVLARPRRVAADDRLLFAWLLTGAGFLWFAFVAERGAFFAHGNFSWGWNIALWLLFLFSTAALARLAAERGERGPALTIALALFALHVASGVAYLVHQLGDGGYF